MTLVLVDLLPPNGAENPSGLATMHGVALLPDFLTLQAADDLATVGATKDTIGSISAAHVFNTGKCMTKIYGTENMGDVTDAVVGSPDSQGGKITVTLMCPGLTSDRQFMKRMLNSAVGILFTTQADGQVLQHGSELFPCHFKVSWKSDKNEGYRGYTIEASCYGNSVIYTPGLNFTPAA